MIDVNEDWMDQIKWTADGLLPVIAQDTETDTVLMMAWMNREALAATRESGFAVYWSRSRGRLWRKGESSGNAQRVNELRLDCDGDTLLLKVQQIGGVACHTGRQHCFYRRLDEAGWTAVEAVIRDPAQMYGDADDAHKSEQVNKHE